MFGRLHLITIGNTLKKLTPWWWTDWNPKNQNGGLDDSIVRTSIGWFLGSSMVPAVNFQGCKVRLAEVGLCFAQIDLTFWSFEWPGIKTTCRTLDFYFSVKRPKMGWMIPNVKEQIWLPKDHWTLQWKGLNLYSRDWVLKIASFESSGY